MASIDPALLRQFVRESRFLRDPHARNAFLNAAAQTSLVEEGGRNVAGGDADSSNWRQERASIYGPAWAKSGGPLNIPASVRRFRQEFQQFYKPGLHSYEIAARVQRPAEQFRGRYRDVARDARRILAGHVAPGGSQHETGVQIQTLARSALGALVSADAVPGSSVATGSTGLVGLLQALSPEKQAPSSMGLAAPAFSAQAAMPAGYRGVQSGGGGPAPKPDVQAMLAAIETAGGDVAHSGVEGAQADLGFGTLIQQAVGGAQGLVSRGRPGKVTVSPSADRPGVRTDPAVVGFVKQVAGLYGRPLTIGTGTNHSRLTVNGNVSEHWSGKAADVPLTGRALVRAGQDALIAAGWSPARARKATGGLYNVQLPNGGRAQIIFNTHEGGDHTNHLHVGLRPGRR